MQQYPTSFIHSLAGPDSGKLESGKIMRVVALECYSYITACIGNHTVKAIAVG